MICKYGPPMIELSTVVIAGAGHNCDLGSSHLGPLLLSRAPNYLPLCHALPIIESLGPWTCFRLDSHSD
eukprot:750365-Hanusia_phi.AAC.3